MDDDLVDVLTVLAVLALGLIGLLVLLVMNVKRFREFFQCRRKRKVHPIIPKRTTIKVARKANTITVEEPRSVTSKTPVQRIFSAPLPERSPAQTPVVTTPNGTKQLVFIVPKPPSYKAELAHSVASAQTSCSTASSYLPNQLPVMLNRRCSA
ncbi:unnamed protein product [Cylicocyclus nassatus]|uniref:Uncharacterized protein n=1 Tax=Cylicocyclus nassatus TaxID=53992 RepID=A0AA36GL95_CYLNA|nr:unnamed protein product [Cylicocyclus nassatus]